ncbi:MAG: hypothetical protein EA401_09300 [Planctomycetota bacterium]|nr:MAG: hypothetical protein EA401_09300 [Planctomycetota bacterium]
MHREAGIPFPDKLCAALGDLGRWFLPIWGLPSDCSPPSRRGQAMHSTQWQQHDLLPGPAHRLVQSCAVALHEQIYEVGPGTGSLTGPMLETGARVVAVEIDGQRVRSLGERFRDACARDQLRVVNGDACTFTPPFTQPWRVIANPPFQHTADLLRHWLLCPPAAGMPYAIDLLIQAQAAQKLSAGSGAWTRSSVLLHLAGLPRQGMRLSRSVVQPPSRVDLAHWSWRCHHDPLDVPTLRAVDYILQQAFRGDHRVRQALRSVATPAILKRQGRDHGWDPDGPARAVPPQAWLELTRFLLHIKRIPSQ